jgi:hypothetical protein
MAAAARTSTALEGARELSVRLPLFAAPADVLRLLDTDASRWLGEPLEASAEGLAGSRRRFATDLRLRVSDRSPRALFRKAAIVELGTPFEANGIVSVEIGWRAATLAPLFPVFSGRLSVDSHDATLRGLYAPPGGRIGQIADDALFHIAAEGTAKWLLREMAAILADGQR